jgi:adenosylcobinamide-phosphate synthase
MADTIPWAMIVLFGAVTLDLLIGDPRWLPHPVVGMGNFISYLEKRWNKGAALRWKGAALTVVTVGTVYATTAIIVFLAYRLHFLIGLFSEIYLISTTIAIKGLRDAAHRVEAPLSCGDLPLARKELGMIVGRDTDTLDEPEIVRATVETVAENTVDAITAPLFWALLGGAPAALAYRAVNTLDSMVGYKNERYIHFGWFSARLDDILNLLPARLTALTIWVSSFFIRSLYSAQAIRITLRDARKHPSPNSGWPESMIASLLGVQLGGRNTYKGTVSERAKLGEPRRQLNKKDIARTIQYMHGGWIVYFIMIVALYIVFALVVTGVKEAV